MVALGPGSVLDAGCGTGRVARELARRGIDVAGVDVDASMIATARQLAPDLDWHLGDVAVLDLGRTFDVVLMAGNVPLFTPPANRGPLVAGCARHLAPDGLLVSRVPARSRLHARGLRRALPRRLVSFLPGARPRGPATRSGGGDYAVSVHRSSSVEDPAGG